MLDYNELASRVGHNINIAQLSNYQTQIIKLDFYDSLVKLHRISEDLKVELNYSVLEEYSAPDTKLTVAAGASNGLTGQYYYKYAYKTPFGYTDASPQEGILLSGSVVELSDIPVKPTGITAILILRTKSGGTTFYKLAEISDDSTTYTDGAADSTLTTVFVADSPNTDPLDLPSDYYAMKEVKFIDNDGRTLRKVELTEEEYIRWNPNASPSSNNIRLIMDGSEPYGTLETEENFRWNGSVGYTLKDQYPVKINHKPRFTGTYKIFYVQVPVPDLSDLSEVPEILRSFYDVLVLGSTTKMLTRRLQTIDKEVQLMGARESLRIFRSEYKDELSKYLGHVNKFVGVMQIMPNSFLNDSEMIL